MKKAGIRFNESTYLGIEADLENIENSKIIAEVNGETTEYSLGGGGGGSSTLDLRNFPHQMTAGDTYQIIYTLTGDATMEFSSNASSSKIIVDENGLMTCVGSTAGPCVITMTTKNSNGDVINEVKMRPTVV